MGRSVFARILKTVLSILGLGFLMGSMATLSYAEKRDIQNPRQEVANRLRNLAKRIEDAGSEEDGSTDGEA